LRETIYIATKKKPLANFSSCKILAVSEVQEFRRLSLIHLFIVLCTVLLLNARNEE
jgi:hypothetical protein